MKRAGTVPLAMLAAATALAQPYGNEWIDLSRPYWCFTAAADGILRIDSATLAAAGFPVATVDPRTIQLFGREQELPVFIQGEDDGVLNGTDHIEVRVARNDGWLDGALYEVPGTQGNPYHSLYNDSIRYYLTWSAGTGAPLRMKPYVNMDFTPHTPRPWVWREALAQFWLTYYLGDRGLFGATSSFMVEGEGYFRSWPLETYGADGTLPFQVPSQNPYQQPDAPPSHIELAVAGANATGTGQCDDHHLRVYYGANLVQALDTTYRGYQLRRLGFDLPTGALDTWATNVQLRAVYDLQTCSGANYQDRQNIAYIKLRYPRALNFGGDPIADVRVPHNGTTDTLALLRFNGFFGTPLVYAYGDTVRRVEAVPDGFGYWQALVPLAPNATETRVFLYRQEQIAAPTDLRPVTSGGQFTDLVQAQQDSAVLIVTHHSLRAAADQYAAMCATSPTNPRNAVVVDMDELYDQFGGGVPKHPLAIRRFAKAALDLWDTDPQALFLMGKSVIAPSVNGLNGHRDDPSVYSQCLVPTFGFPPSDVCFTLGLGGDPTDMPIPVGRLAASTPDMVDQYRAKVQQFEAWGEPEPWMKNILHFRGGFTASEHQQFSNYLREYELLAEDTNFIGRVVQFNKNNPGVLGQASADSVKHLIEDEGVTLMTFFAHASGGGFDITIDNPANYNWNGKYPAIIGNSCYAGNVHLATAESASEKYVLVPNAGAVAFMASVDLGLSNMLYNYTWEWYRSFSQVNYGRSIGAHMRHAVHQQLQGGGYLPANNAQTFTLHGDPALVLHSFDRPDLSVSAPDVLLSPDPVTADLDTFTVDVVVTNLGKGVGVGTNVVLQRRLVEENQVLQPMYAPVSAATFKDTVRFRLPVLATEGGQGLNALDVRVDLDPDLIPEMDDLGNNAVQASLLITSGEIFPVEPFEFAIIPDAAPTLKASTGDPFAPVRSYRFQIDTTDTYDSPVMEEVLINAPGGVVSWSPQQIFGLNAQQDSLVFFWRCTPDSTGDGSPDWRGSSFQHITDRRGWGQAHFFQFKDDAFLQVVHDRPQRKFLFNDAPRGIRCEVTGNSGLLCSYFIDLQWVDGQGCGGERALHVAVIDPATFEPWKTCWNGQDTDHQFGNVNSCDSLCERSNRAQMYFSYWPSSPSHMAGLTDLLQNQVPTGYHVLMWSYLGLNKPGMDANGGQPLYDAFNAIGATDLQTAPDTVPYIFFGTKGDPGSVIQVMGAYSNDAIDLSTFVTTQGVAGDIVAPWAGPASEWKGMYWDEAPNDIRDSVNIQVFGVTPQGAEQLVFERGGPLDSIPQNVFQSGIDAAQFPYVRLRAKLLNDSVAAPLPSQLRRWQLLMTPEPECAIDPPLGFLSNLEGIAEPMQAQLAVAVHNISPFDMDSLLMHAWVVGANGQRRAVHNRRNAPLPAGGVLMDTIRFSTDGLGGLNTVIIEANPVDSTTGLYDQYEQYHFNNIAQLRFTVSEDKENPLLDVTFDGVHILDGDIVSARPEVLVTLDDENPVLLMDQPTDTVHFKVFLTDPSGTIRRIHFRDGTGTEQMRFLPATGQDNIARIDYRPVFTVDGIYKLTVQADDVSGNISGDRDHSIRFEVITRPTITDVLNYPNPFTTSTRFVFTVTGSEPPTYLKLQILTITGRVVREVGLAELGPVRVGRNITEFAWDGTDQFGDRLGRGVYLYRVIAQLHGEDMERRESGASAYTEKGFGKMYLLY